MAFRRNRVTKELLRRIHAHIYDLGTTALSGSEQAYHERKGEQKGMKWVLAELDGIASDTELSDALDDEEGIDLA